MVLIFIFLNFQSINVNMENISGKNSIDSSIFKILKNKMVSSQTKPIYSIKANSNLNCLMKCFHLTKQFCQFVVYKPNKCDIYRIKCFNYSDLIETPTAEIVYVNKKYDYCFELTNYWSFDGNLKDSIGQAHMTGKFSPFFDQDRFNRPNSSLLIDDLAHPGSSCFDLPNGTYVNTDYTLSVWLKLFQHRNHSALLAISSGNFLLNSALFFLTGDKTLARLSITNSTFTNSYGGISASTQFNIGVWHHLAFSVNQTTAMIFINGTVNKIAKKIISPGNVIRTQVQLGIWRGFQSGYYQIDDLKLFNSSLDEVEIKKIMNT